MRVRKALIPAGGRGSRLYPASARIPKQMFPLVDRDGVTKPVIQIIAEEALDSGIEQIGIVIRPGDEEIYRSHFQGISDDMLSVLTSQDWALRESEKIQRLEAAINYIVQESPEGMGHAVYCAREWVGNEPFLLLTGDQIYISHSSLRCSKQLLDVSSQYNQNIFPLKRTPENQLYLFGTVEAEPISDESQIYQIHSCIEKPELAYAREHFRVPSLPQGYYLCFFGMYIFTPSLFDCLEYHIRHNLRVQGEIQLTSAQNMLCQVEPVYGMELAGQAYDMGRPFGFVETQLALALHSVNYAELLAAIDRINLTAP